MLTALPDGRLALAVSGGSDSMAMLHMVLRQRPAALLVVLTVDHGLRDASRAEVEFVAAACASLGVEHHILTWLGEKPASGLQAKARQARYDLLAQWCVGNGVGALLTGHTMNDQAETVAMRRLRTTSPKSLAGIWPESTWDGVRIIRPLLQARRADLSGFLRDAGVDWIEDPSNDNPKFERVRVRAALAEGDVARLAAVADAARAETESAAATARDWLRGNAVVEASGLVRLPRKELADRFGVTQEIFSRAIHMAGGGNPELETIEGVLVRIMGGECFRATLGGAMVAVRHAEILLGREPARIRVAPVPVGNGPLLWDGRFRISAPVASLVAPAGPRCPKPAKALPAFVLAGLPAVTLPDGSRILPHFQSAAGISVSLGERFHL